MERMLEAARQDFMAARMRQSMSATQRAALQIIAGIDMDALLAAEPPERRQAAQRLARLIERERLKGLRGHWSYDLNRHIALKQALDRLEA